LRFSVSVRQKEKPSICASVVSPSIATKHCELRSSSGELPLLIATFRHCSICFYTSVEQTFLKTAVFKKKTTNTIETILRRGNYS